MQLKNLRVALFVFAALSIVHGTASAGNEQYRVARGEVVVVCPLTIGGGFEAKTQAVSGEVALAADQSGAIKGSMSVDLRTLKTGTSGSIRRTTSSMTDCTTAGASSARTWSTPSAAGT